MTLTVLSARGPAGGRHASHALTHVIPPLGAEQLGRYKLPAVLTEAGYGKQNEASGFQGSIGAWKLISQA